MTNDLLKELAAVLNRHSAEHASDRAKLAAWPKVKAALETLVFCRNEHSDDCYECKSDAEGVLSAAEAAERGEGE